MILTYDPANVHVTIGGQTYSDGTEWWADDHGVGTLWGDLLATYRACRRRWRGRWVVMHTDELGVCGRRFSSLSRARRYARSVGGRVRRYRAEDWMPALPEPTWNVTLELREGDGTGESATLPSRRHEAARTSPRKPHAPDPLASLARLWHHH